PHVRQLSGILPEYRTDGRPEIGLGPGSRWMASSQLHQVSIFTQRAIGTGSEPAYLGLGIRTPPTCNYPSPIRRSGNPASVARCRPLGYDTPNSALCPATG